MLADLTRVGYLPKVWLAPEAVRELRRLIRLRAARVKQRRATKLRIGALLREHRLRGPQVTRWTKAWLAWLSGVEMPEQSRWVVDRELTYLQFIERDLRQVERRLTQVTKHDPIVTKLQGQPGVGPVTSWVLRAMVGRFDRFRSGKQLARFCSVSPRNASSGSSGTRQADAGLIKAGDPLLRATLIELAQRLMRMPGRFGALGRALRDRGKPYCVAAAAVANRYVRWLFHVMREAAPAVEPT
jgi:transposase